MDFKIFEDDYFINSKAFKQFISELMEVARIDNIEMNVKTLLNFGHQYYLFKEITYHNIAVIIQDEIETGYIRINLVIGHQEFKCKYCRSEDYFIKNNHLACADCGIVNSKLSNYAADNYDEYRKAELACINRILEQI